jgi:hypothetical protein
LVPQAVLAAGLPGRMHTMILESGLRGRSAAEKSRLQRF